MATTTFAWFSTTSTRNVSVTSFEAVNGDILTIKSYANDKVGDDWEGYDFSTRSSFSSVDYSTDFVELSTDGVSFPALVPSCAYTFAFEVTNKTGSANLSLMLNYLCSASFDNGDSDIYLSSAIKMYCAEYRYQASEDLDAIATSFIHNESYTNLFSSNSASGSNVVLYDSSDYVTDKMIVFFTFVFSDDSDTYYAYSDSASKFVKSTSGNSNVYQDLDFNIGTMIMKGNA